MTLIEFTIDGDSSATGAQTFTLQHSYTFSDKFSRILNQKSGSAISRYGFQAIQRGAGRFWK